MAVQRPNANQASGGASSSAPASSTSSSNAVGNGVGNSSNGVGTERPTSRSVGGSSTFAQRRGRSASPVPSPYRPSRGGGGSGSGGGVGSGSSNGSVGRRRHGGGGGHNNNNRHKDFNPRLILSQIVALQSFHYLILGFIFQCNHVVFATSVTIDRIFTSKFYDVWTADGWVDNSAVLLSSVIGAVLLALIVEKSKKCLDFSVTLFLIHLAFCTAYGGLPSTWDWWIVHVLGMIVMIVLGEYLCSKRELSDIPLLVI